MNFSVLSRLTTIAAVVLASASAAVRAEPPSTPTHGTKPAASHSSSVQLASADQAQKVSAPDAPSQAAVKKPASRVTTCRCGGQPSDDESDQPQD